MKLSVIFVITMAIACSTVNAVPVADPDASEYVTPPPAPPTTTSQPTRPPRPPTYTTFLTRRPTIPQYTTTELPPPPVPRPRPRPLPPATTTTRAPPPPVPTLPPRQPTFTSPPYLPTTTFRPRTTPDISSQQVYPTPTTITRAPPPRYRPPPSTYAPAPPSCRAGRGRPTAQCARSEVSPGVYAFVCEVSNECDITIQREDILWLEAEGADETINVVVPNYKLEEVIKAAFKSTAGKATGVNILLRRPTFTAEAEIDTTVPERGAPEVYIEYEPVPQKEVVHYPTNQQYRALSGPILEP